MKKTSCGLIGNFTIKKIQILFEGCFLENFSYFIVFLVLLEIVTFHSETPLMTNLIYSQMKPKEQQKFVFKESLVFFLLSNLSFRNFK